MAMLSGLLLGPVFGGLAVLLFLLLGTVGLPVFTGKAGLHVLLAGPTSGFLWGYFFAAVIGGTILALFELTQKDAADKSGQNEASPEPQAKKSRASNIARIAIISLAALAATITAFACGVAGGIIVMHFSLEKALPLYILPFIPGNLIKLVLMVLLTKKFRPTILAYTN